MRPVIRLLTRFLLGFLALVLLLAIAGFAYQKVAEARDRRTSGLPGEMVDAGGFDLHLLVMGEPSNAPVVILENGGSGIVPQWGWIQPEVAQFSQVVAYDRPGTGWSEAPAAQLDAVGSARALHTALENRRIDGPYILAGHSMGSLMIRVFAELYPDEVVGLVHIDPRVLTWEGVFSEEESSVPIGMFRILEFLSHFGVTRITGFAAQQVEGLPEESCRQAVAIGSTPQYLAGFSHEERYGETAIEFLSKSEDLEDTNTIVLSSGSPDASFNQNQRKNFTALHADLAARSSQGEHRIVPGAGHLSIMTDQEHAAAVTEAIRDMVSMVIQR